MRLSMLPRLRPRAMLFGLVILTVGVSAARFSAHGWGAVPTYRLTTVQRGSLSAAVSATGTLNAVTTVQVGSQVSGQIRRLLVDFNDHVNNGQVIARIDPDIFEAKVSQASVEIMALFQELNRSGITIVLVTHEPDIARYAGRLLTFRDGRVVTDEEVPTPADAQAILGGLPPAEAAP